jgi:flagellin-like protein
MNRFNKEDATSESIGTVLTVAITVTLAAAAMAFFFGMADDVEMTYVVGASAKFVDDAIVVTYHGGPDHDRLERLDWSIYNGTGSKYAGPPANKWLDHPEIGDSTGPIGSFSEGRYRVLVVATFAGGSQQVILDKDLVKL